MRLAGRLGRRLKELREELGITQEKLAYESGLRSKGYLSDIEAGKKTPTLPTLERLAERLGVELFDLLVFRGGGPRHELADLSRLLDPADIDALIADARRRGQDR